MGCIHSNPRPELLSMAKRLREIREGLKVTQREMVILIAGGGKNSVSRYENAIVPPPNAYVVLLMLLEKHPELLDEIRVISLKAYPKV